MARHGRPRRKLLVLVLLAGPGLIAFDSLVLRGGGPSSALAEAATNAVVEQLTAGADAQTARIGVPELLRMTAATGGDAEAPALSELFAVALGPAAAEAGAATPSRAPRDFTLTAVLLSPKRPAAVINGAVVRPGDTITGTDWTLAAVEDDAVELHSGEKRRRIPLESRF